LQRIWGPVGHPKPNIVLLARICTQSVRSVHALLCPDPAVPPTSRVRTHTQFTIPVTEMHSLVALNHARLEIGDAFRGMRCLEDLLTSACVLPP